MNRKYQPHESSLGDLQANIVVLIVWLGPAILNIFAPNIGYFGLLVPLIFLLVEKKSELVRDHAGQALSLYVVTNVFIWVITIIFGIIFAGSFVAGAVSPTVGILSGLSAAGMIGLFGLVIGITQLVFVILACVKGWKWESYTLPVIGKLGKWFTEKVKLS